LILLVGVAGLQMANFVADQFERATWLGFASLAILTPAIVVLSWSFQREWRGYAILRRIEVVRRGLSGQDLVVARRHAESWLSAIGAPEDTLSVVRQASDSMTLRELLLAGPLAEAQERAKKAGRAAALQILGATAASPSPGFDGVLVVWRSLRLVREIAQIYGHRPGAAGTLALFRRVVLDASAVAATEVAVSSTTEALLTSPLAGGLAGQAAGGAVAARRMIRLAHATAATCSPL
jgi:putative membrane protein